MGEVYAKFVIAATIAALIILPLVSAFETPLPLPNSITESVLGGEAEEITATGSH